MKEANKRNPAGTIVVLVLVGFALLVAGGRWYVKWKSKGFVPPMTRPATR